MAAIVVPPSDFGAPEMLAVDMSRLAEVAAWRPEFGADPATVVSALAPPTAPDAGYLAPLEFRGTTLEVDVDRQIESFNGFRPPEVGPIDLNLELVSTDGNPVVATLRELPEGRKTFTVDIRGCDAGCRFVGFESPNANFNTRLTLHALRQLDPPADILGPADLGERLRWRGDDNTLVTPTSFGVSARIEALDFALTGMRVAVMDAPVPIPVAAVNEQSVSAVASVDGASVPSHRALSLSMLPRLGTHGVLADLNYLEQTLLDAPQVSTSEIWLSDSAPADAANQFRRAGLAVVGERDLAGAREAMAIQGPALALQFHLAAAAFGVLLALGGLWLVAAVDRRSRAADLRALRAQGLRRRMARRAALWGYLSIVVLAALTGLAGAAVAWAAAGDRLPIFTDASSVLQPPRWPTVMAVVEPWGITTGLMVVAAVLASWALRRATGRPNGNGGAR
jgi:hypothetical protein